MAATSSANTPSTVTAKTSDFADHAERSADNAIRSTQRVANETLNNLSGKVHEVRDQAETLARKGVDAVLETSAQLRERAQRATDSTVGYIKDEPVKAMLIAAATGAALMALVGLLSSRSRDR
jgi:ElaB/YqjD/DUF883 family membrane-anchored ribosome-binding protein